FSFSWISLLLKLLLFFSSRRRHTRFSRDWSSDVCSSDLKRGLGRKTARIEDLVAHPRILRGGALSHVRMRDQPHHAPLRFGGSRSEERRVGKVLKLRMWRKHLKLC